MRHSTVRCKHFCVYFLNSTNENLFCSSIYLFRLFFWFNGELLLLGTVRANTQLPGRWQIDIPLPWIMVRCWGIWNTGVRVYENVPIYWITSIVYRVWRPNVSWKMSGKWPIYLLSIIQLIQFFFQFYFFFLLIVVSLCVCACDLYYYNVNWLDKFFCYFHYIYCFFFFLK